LNQVQFDSKTFQERNGTCGMKPEHSGRNLAEKSGTDRDLKWDENCSVLFCFLNWYEMFRPLWTEQNRINNFSPNCLCSHVAKKKKDHDRQYLKKHNFISCILESHTRTQLSLHFRLLPPAYWKHHQLSYRNSWSNYGSWGTHKLWKQEAERGGPQQLLL